MMRSTKKRRDVKAVMSAAEVDGLYDMLDAMLDSRPVKAVAGGRDDKHVNKTKRVPWSEHLKRELPCLSPILTYANFPDIKRMFPPTDRAYLLEMDHEAAWSISTPTLMAGMLTVVEAAIESKKETSVGPFEFVEKSLAQMCVVDATANVGGSALALAAKCAHVTAVELAASVYKMLVNNVALYPELAPKIRAVNCNYIDLVTDECDMVFIDPPWGGLDYAKEDAGIELCLEKDGKKYGMGDIARLTRARWFVIKAPKNYDHTKDFPSCESLLGDEMPKKWAAVCCMVRSTKLVIVDTSQI